MQQTDGTGAAGTGVPRLAGQFPMGTVNDSLSFMGSYIIDYQAAP